MKKRRVLLYFSALLIVGLALGIGFAKTHDSKAVVSERISPSFDHASNRAYIVGENEELDSIFQHWDDEKGAVLVSFRFKNKTNQEVDLTAFVKERLIFQQRMNGKVVREPEFSVEGSLGKVAPYSMGQAALLVKVPQDSYNQSDIFLGVKTSVGSEDYAGVVITR